MPDRVTLYRAPSTVADADEIATWLDARVEATVRIRDRFVEVHPSDDLAERFAAARVLSPYRPETGTDVLGVLRYEDRVLANPERAGGVLYDGIAVQRALNGELPASESDLDHLHVVLLDRVVGTWGEDGRWHKRVTVLGQPAIVSIPGLYEAPAKPDAYYRERQRDAMQSGTVPPREVLEGRIEGAYLVENDPRTTEAVKGNVLQAVHLLETGEAFCDDPRCRLANPHRQPGVVRAQLEPPEFCDVHARIYRR